MKMRNMSRIEAKICPIILPTLPILARSMLRIVKNSCRDIQIKNVFVKLHPHTSISSIFYGISDMREDDFKWVSGTIQDILCLSDMVFTSASGVVVECIYKNKFVIIYSPPTDINLNPLDVLPFNNTLWKYITNSEEFKTCMKKPKDIPLKKYAAMRKKLFVFNMKYLDEFYS